MKQLNILLFFIGILICSNAYSITNKNSSIRIKVFEYLKAKNEYVGYNASYSEYKNSFYIYDLRKITTINNRCICFFGVYNEENNQYLLYRSGLIVRFIDPTETKFEEAIKLLLTVFKGKYPYEYHSIVKDIKAFYNENKNSIITIEPQCPPSPVQPDMPIIK